MDPYPTLHGLGPDPTPQATRPWWRRRIPVASGLTALTLAATAATLVVAAAPSSPPVQPTVQTTAPAALVDTAVVEALVAAARLEAFALAPPPRRVLLLDRIQAGIAATTAALDDLADTSVSSQAQAAAAPLRTLEDLLADLDACLAASAPAATAPAAPPPTTGPTPAPRSSEDPGTKTNTGTRGPGCAVSVEEVAVARAAGAHLAALAPHGSLSPDRLAALAEQISEQAVTEATSPGAPPVTSPHPAT